MKNEKNKELFNLTLRQTKTSYAIIIHNDVDCRPREAVSSVRKKLQHTPHKR